MQNSASTSTRLPQLLRRTLNLLACLMAAGTLSGCVNPEWRALQQARLLWEANGIYSYSYDLQISCFCVEDVTRPVRVLVQNDQAVSVEYIDAKADAPAEYFVRYDTIDKLFDIVEDGIVGGAEVVEVDYNPDFGYPASVFIDESMNLQDEEIAWTVQNLVTLRSSP